MGDCGCGSSIKTGQWIAYRNGQKMGTVLGKSKSEAEHSARVSFKLHQSDYITVRKKLK